MSTAIHASRDAVWRALTAPSELIRWHDQIRELLEPAPETPRVGQRLRWRFAMGSVEMTVDQIIRQLDPRERLRSEFLMRLFRLDETYRLQTDPLDGSTRVSLQLTACNSIAIVGGSLDRFAVRKLCVRLIDSRLRAVQNWCESG